MQKHLLLGDRRIGPGEPCFVIAEAGTNHNGQIETALALIDCAASAGADCVKFQTFRADALVAPTDHPIAKLTDSFGRFGSTVHEMFRKAEMPPEWLPDLIAHAKHRGILFLSTPFDEESADLLDKLGLPAFKIASYEIVHLPLLRHIARMGKPMLLSTGMASLGEIEEALATIAAAGNAQVALFHCPIGYPVTFGDVHLAAIDTIRQAFGVPVGLSDHTLGITAPLAAVARGADLIEKHFTLDARQHGPDHDFAADPTVLKAMVDGIRDVTQAIGDPLKVRQPSEELHYRRGRRSIFAGIDIEMGQVIKLDMLAILRPGVGLPPRFLDTVIGRQARRSIRAFAPVTWDDI